ncbi:hypothetical protein L3X38_023991 [Prunus dulcis]|uniref:Uncharacterized protein n=1 Tax=Prunus dulcis TaxID=3755 RepID=A0AAD4W0K5_PRUDU|nr:hypothetical protein L3X38_023991 [Prunus dulcis]
MPYFASARGPMTINDSLLLDNDVAIRVARSFVTYRDVCVLGTRYDNQLLSDAMTLSVQSTASVTSCTIRRLKRDRVKTLEERRHQLKILQEENQKLSKMVDFYSKDMKEQLEALDRLDKRA